MSCSCAHADLIEPAVEYVGCVGGASHPGLEGGPGRGAAVVAGDVLGVGAPPVAELPVALDHLPRVGVGGLLEPGVDAEAWQVAARALLGSTAEIPTTARADTKLELSTIAVYPN